MELDTGAIADLADGALARMIASESAARAAAEAELYRRFAPRVRLYGLKHLRDEDAARDLVQQVMLVTIERLRGRAVRDADQIGSFILGTSRMIAESLQRTVRRRQAILDRSFVAVVAEPPPTTLDDQAHVERCLDALRERERTVLILTFYDERPAGEIATALGMNAGAVRVLRHRALSRMRQCLEMRSRS